MATEYFNQGSSYPMEPEYGSNLSGYNSRGAVGLATDPRTANQLQEIARKLNVGTKAIEISTVSAEVFESIPDQHLDEIRRISKLAGAELSLHAPIVEPSGFDREGKWSESNRVMTERQMLDAVLRAKKLDSKGNINVTFHSSAGLPEGLTKVKELVEENGKKVMKDVVKGMAIVDPMSGSVHMIKESEKFFPEKEEKGKFEERELAKINEKVWLDTLNNLAISVSRGENILEEAPNSVLNLKGTRLNTKDKEELERAMLHSYKTGKDIPDEEIKKWKEKGGDIEAGMINEIKKDYTHAQVFLMDSFNNLKELYNRVYKETKDPKAKEALDKYAESIRGDIKKGVETDPEQLRRFADIIENGISVLRSKEVQPKIYRPLNEFVIEKSAETFGNVAWSAFEKAKPEEKGRLPVMSIENPPVGGAISRAEDLKSLIGKARDVFIQKATSKEAGSARMSESEAKKTAEKLIGATWDVGHINMLRKYGYSKEDIIKQAEIIAPMVKHVHLSDNFGMEHTELPMGMGTVPMKEIAEKLEKAGVSPKKIIEAGNWYQHFKTIPFRETLAGLKAPVYGGKPGAPYWNETAGTMGGYGVGYGNFLPEEHVSMYGAGFSSLPTELGGQSQQRGSKFSGTPME